MVASFRCLLTKRADITRRSLHFEEYMSGQGSLMGLLPSAIFSQKSMGVHIVNGLIYNICEVYIDDMLVFGETDDAFLRNVKTVFQRCREKNVTLIAKKLVIGVDTVPFVGHEISATAINMSKKRKNV